MFLLPSLKSFGVFIRFYSRISLFLAFPHKHWPASQSLSGSALFQSYFSLCSSAHYPTFACWLAHYFLLGCCLLKFLLCTHSVWDYLSSIPLKAISQPDRHKMPFHICMSACVPDLFFCPLTIASAWTLFAPITTLCVPNLCLLDSDVSLMDSEPITAFCLSWVPTFMVKLILTQCFKFISLLRDTIWRRTFSVEISATSVHLQLVPSWLKCQSYSLFICSFFGLGDKGWLLHLNIVNKRCKPFLVGCLFLAKMVPRSFQSLKTSISTAWCFHYCMVSLGC